MNLVEHLFGGGNQQHLDKQSNVRRDIKLEEKLV